MFETKSGYEIQSFNHFSSPYVIIRKDNIDLYIYPCRDYIGIVSEDYIDDISIGTLANFCDTNGYLLKIPEIFGVSTYFKEDIKLSNKMISTILLNDDNDFVALQFSHVSGFNIFISNEEVIHIGVNILSDGDSKIIVDVSLEELFNIEI